jgi:hypothetical protein
MEHEGSLPCSHKSHPTPNHEDRPTQSTPSQLISYRSPHLREGRNKWLFFFNDLLCINVIWAGDFEMAWQVMVALLTGVTEQDDDESKTG